MLLAGVRFSFELEDLLVVDGVEVLLLLGVDGVACAAVMSVAEALPYFSGALVFFS